MDNSENYLGVVAICGDEGTGKTSMSLTFPKGVVHLDIDVGGYRRAIWRMEGEGISSISFPKPIQIDKLKGADISSTRIIIPKKVTGMLELWQEIVQKFVDACMDKDANTIVIDSATALWNICHQSHLQELQSRQLSLHNSEKPHTPFNESSYRERLQPIEYGPANDRMRTLVHTARSCGKNLILTHYPTDEYGTIPDGKGNMVEGKTGVKILDGFKETTKLADLVVWTSIRDMIVEGNKVKQPVCKITKCGLDGMGLAVVGMEIAATYQDVINLRNTLSGGG